MSHANLLGASVRCVALPRPCPRCSLVSAMHCHATWRPQRACPACRVCSKVTKEVLGCRNTLVKWGVPKGKIVGARWVLLGAACW